MKTLIRKIAWTYLLLCTIVFVIIHFISSPTLDTNRVDSSGVNTKPQYLNYSLPFKYDTLYTGGSVEVPLENNLSVYGKINCVQSEVGFVRIGGHTNTGAFAFTIHNDTNEVSGFVFHESSYVYELLPTPPTLTPIFTKRKVSDLLCVSPDDSLLELSDIVSSGTQTNTPTKALITKIPLLNSSPSSKFVCLLVFGGATIQDPMWNGGKLLNIEPSKFSETEITDIFNIVSQKYSSFNINITTNADLYNKAEKGNKMRVIVGSNIPYNIIKQGSAGIAFIGALNHISLGILSPTSPAFVDSSRLRSIDNVAYAIAHEFGHTFGLKHDGTSYNPYYGGSGAYGPIMGAPYNKTVVQFSNGDYPDANNNQNDIYIIANTKNVGYVQPENNNSGLVVAGRFLQSNYIVSSNDVQYYIFDTLSGGTATLKVTSPKYSALKPVVKLYEKNTLKTYAISDVTYGVVSEINVKIPSGTYVIEVRGGGEGNPLRGGYSKYGSIGRFTISGVVPSDSKYHDGDVIKVK